MRRTEWPCLACVACSTASGSRYNEKTSDLHPQKEPFAIGTATRFWNWNAERYARQAIADEASYQKKLAITQSYLTPDMRVVEFGCGTGSTAIVHAPKVKTGTSCVPRSRP